MAILAFPSYSWACPTISAACDNGGVDICEVSVSGHLLECNLTNNGGSADANATAIRSDDVSGPCGGTNFPYCIEGTDTSGHDFCCTFPDGNYTVVSIRGGAEKDIVHLYYATYDLENNPSGATVLNGIVYGGDDTDIIVGSRKVSSDYHDVLHGDEGDDEIHGQDGDDQITGDDDDDDLYGEDGHDTIDGGLGLDYIEGGPDGDTISGRANSDTIEGNGGEDIIHGDAGQDNISGGVGDDSLYGGDDVDTICGDNDNDDLHGESGNEDILFQGGGTGSQNGGLGSGDLCDPFPSITSTMCEFAWTFGRPGACPDP